MTHPNSVAAAPELVFPPLNGMKIPEVSVRSADGSMFEITKSCGAKTCDCCFLSRRMVTALQKAVGPTARTESAI